MNKVTFISAAVLMAAGCAKKVPEAVSVVEAPVVSQSAETRVPTTMAEAVDRLAANFRRVHFEFDSDELNSGSKEALAANAAILQRFGGLVVEVQGHADERGTVDYNIALGQRRADAVRGYMVAQGAREGQLRTASYGEEMPLDNGRTESAWSQNRRAEFRVIVPEGPVAGSTR